MTRSATARLVTALCAAATMCCAATISVTAGVLPLVLAPTAEASPPDGDAQRIEFSPGTDSATVQGDVEPGSADRYVLRAAAGQVMSVATDSPEANAFVTVYGTDGRVLNAGHVTASVGLPADGDYVVEVSAGGGPTSYAMTVQIHDSTPPPPSPDTIRRIEFAPGTDNGSVEGAVESGATHRYVLWAAAGQTMSIDIDSVEETADIAVLGPSGISVGEGPAGYVLPLNGDYLVEVTSDGGVATYAMTVTITDSTGTEERVEFAPGTNHESVTGDIFPGTANRYALWAAAGQTMVVHVSSVTQNITFSIVGPDGTPLAEDQSQATVVLPADGDYVVAVESTSSGGPYRASFWIE